MEHENTHDNAVSYVANERSRKILNPWHPFETEHCAKVRFLKDPNTAGYSVYQCLTEKFEDLTFSFTASIDRCGDFSVASKAVHFDREIYVHRVDRYFVNLNMNSQVCQAE